MRRPNIPDDVERAVLRHAAASPGATAQVIADAITQECGTPIARRTVAKILERTRTERANITKTVLRGQLTKSVLSDLDVLQEQRDRLLEMCRVSFDEWRETKQGVEFRRNSAELREIIAMRLKYSGADEPDTNADEFAKASERLAGRLDRLAPGERTGAAPTGDRTDSD